MALGIVSVPDSYQKTKGVGIAQLERQFAWKEKERVKVEGKVLEEPHQLVLFLS